MPPAGPRRRGPVVAVGLAAASCPSRGPVLLLDVRVRPFIQHPGRLWPLLTSPAPSRAIAAPLPRFSRRDRKASQGKTRPFPLVAARSTCARVRVIFGRPRPGAGLPHRAGLVSGSCSSAPGFTSGFLPTPPHSDAVAFGSRFPSPRPTEDFHLQGLCHAWHTTDTSPSSCDAGSQ